MFKSTEQGTRDIKQTPDVVRHPTGIEPIRWIIGAGRGTAGRRRPEALDLDDWTPKQRFIMRDYGGLQLAQGYPPPRTL